MAAHGVKAIEISGNYTSRDAKALTNEAYFKNFALAVKNRVDVPIIIVGGHRSVEMMNRWKSGDLRHSECVSCN